MNLVLSFTPSTADKCKFSIVLKMVKVSKLAQRKLIPHRSIIGLGAFRKINILEIFPDSYCAHRYLTIKSKLFKNMFLLSCLFTIQISQLKKALKTDSN